MLKKYKLLISLFLFVTLLIFQFALLTILHYLFKDVDLNQIVLIAIDLSFILVIAISFCFFYNKTFEAKFIENAKIHVVILLLFICLIWFYFSPYFKISGNSTVTNLKISYDKIYLVIDDFTFLNFYSLIRVLIIVPILEELFYRKIILTNVLKKYNFYIAIAFSSLLFSVGHLDFENSLVFFVFGLILGTTYLYTKNIKISILFHMIVNILTIIVI